MGKPFCFVLFILIILTGNYCQVMAETSDMKVPFEVTYIQDLQNETGKAKGTEGYDFSTQITRSTIDFEKAAEPYRHIHLKKGYRLDGFFLDDGMGSFTVPFILPENEPYSITYTNETPDGRADPPFVRFFNAGKSGRILKLSYPDTEGRDVIALPEHADRAIMSYFTGDDTPESYLEASVFQRELDALDAGWHAAIGWPIQKVISYQDTPSVTMNKTHAVVRITTTEEYCMGFTIFLYEDTYTRGNLTPVSEIDVVPEKDANIWKRENSLQNPESDINAVPEEGGWGICF
jgi:hypothetical protein